MGITDEKISHDQGMTSYRCQVLSFEDKMRSWKPGRLLRLKSFYVNGVKLRLQVYPNGDSNANRDFTSIFVDSMSPNDIVIDMNLSMGRRRALRYNLLERCRTAQLQVMYFAPILLIFSQIG